MSDLIDLTENENENENENKIIGSSNIPTNVKNNSKTDAALVNILQQQQSLRQKLQQFNEACQVQLRMHVANPQQVAHISQQRAVHSAQIRAKLTQLDQQLELVQLQRQNEEKPANVEDANFENEIVTFSEYQPTAISRSVGLAIESYGRSTTATTTTATTTTSDDDDDDSTPFKFSIPSHTFPSVESGLMSSVTAPLTSPQAFTLLAKTATSANKLPLSPLQIEGVMLCLSRHNRVFLPSQTTLNIFNPAGNPPTVQTGTRAGFFLGDGAGIGKGRQISTIIFDSIMRGRTRHLWVSVSRELSGDAIRDLKDVGCCCPVFDGTELLDRVNYDSKKTAAGRKGLGNSQSADSGSKGGVLFMTYQLLISTSRAQQAMTWLAGGKGKGGNDFDSFDGVVVFDEAHKAKNAEKDTQTAAKVIILQKMLPMARFVYASATGVSDIKQMVYAERLMLWGPFTPYPSFENFKKCLDDRGIGGLELLSLEMKMSGGFVARTLSWEGAEFSTNRVELNQAQEAVYNSSSVFWKTVKGKIAEAVEHIKKNVPNGSTNKFVMRVFWAAQQRFFKELAVNAKLPWLIEDIKSSLEQGRHVVVGLQTTGEAGTLQTLDMELAKKNFERYGDATTTDPNLKYEDLKFAKLLSTTAGIAKSFLYNNFPVRSEPIELPPEPTPLDPSFPHTPEDFEKYQNQMIAHQQLTNQIAKGPPPDLEELVKLRDSLVEMVDDLDLPYNCIDTLIDNLGGVDKVAEMTGRTGRMVRDGSMFRYKKRAGNNEKTFGLSAITENIAVDQINIVEKKKFMDGKKQIAIISDAASTGISLHASETCGTADRRRVHYTIELPWAADKAIQQLGRTHRSGQKSAPVYKLVVSNLGGENRFAASVAKRMASLGAITKGDRRAATGSSMGEFNIDSKHGSEGLKKLYECARLNNGGTVPTIESAGIIGLFFETYGESYNKGEATYRKGMDEAELNELGMNVVQATLVDIGLDNGDDAREKNSVNTFLNKIQGAPVGTQNLLFSLFESCVQGAITTAKASGWYEGCVEDVKASWIGMKSPEVLCVDGTSGARTVFKEVECDRGVGLGALLEMISKGGVVEVEGSGEEKKIEIGDSDEDLDDFIVGDSDEDLPQAATTTTATTSSPKLQRSTKRDKTTAQTGFWISRQKIFGQFLVLYAQRKNLSVGENEDEDDSRGMMRLTRPNTGPLLQEKTSRDLKSTYELVASEEQVKGLNVNNEINANVLKGKFPRIFELWSNIYALSDGFDYDKGLAPRRWKFALVTGACMHILPALEKAVKNRSKKDRALRVVRVEASDGGQGGMNVGIRFPADDEAKALLKENIGILLLARKGAVRRMEEQKFKEVDEKCFEWGRKERKNIMNFFQKPKENKSVGGGSGGSSSSSRFFASTATTTTKGAKRTIGKAGAVKKPKSSFFSQQQTTNKTEAELVEDAIKASLEEA